MHRSALTNDQGDPLELLSGALSLHNPHLQWSPLQILASLKPFDAKLSPAGPELPLPVLSWTLWARARGAEGPLTGIAAPGQAVQPLTPTALHTGRLSCCFRHHMKSSPCLPIVATSRG